MSNRDLVRRIDELILDDGYTEYDNLPDDSKDELTALAIKAMGRADYEVIVESDNMSDMVDDLIGHLLNGTPDSAERLANTMRDSARTYKEKMLRELFEERANDLECERLREAGLHPIVDQHNGEVRWIR